MSEREVPPGPDGYPIVGSMMKYGLDPFEYRKAWADEYEDIVYVDGGVTRDGYIVTQPRHFEQILVDDDNKYRRPREYQEIFRNGLGASEGEFWRQQRELIQPAFYPDRIKSYAQDMLAATQDLLADWNDGEVRDIESEMKGLTLDVFSRTVFGIDDIGEYPEIREACEAISDKAAASNQVYPSWMPTEPNRRYSRAEQKMNDALDEIIEERKREEDDSLLSMLLDAEADDGHQMSDDTLRDEMVSLLFAGHETTALSLTYTWYLLSRNDAERERLFTEADEVLGDGEFGPQTAMQLQYTDKLVKESLRRLCPAHSLFRQPQEDVVVDGYTIPEDAAIFLPIWLLHHDEQHFEEPMEFRPDRWDGTLQQELPKYAYIPFGAGPHRCIGERFAKMELRMMLPLIAREFELDYVGEGPLEFKASLTAEPKNDMQMRLTERPS
jgi:cytochrome P450